MRPSARAIVFTREEILVPNRGREENAFSVTAQERAHIVLADAIRAQIDSEAGGLAGIGARAGLAMQGAQKRAQEQDRANHRRRRIAGQAQDAHGPEPPMHQRLAGPHGDAPEAKLHSGRDERLLHEVVIADRGAAERHQHVGFGVARLSQGRLQRAELVDRDPEIDRDASARLDNPRRRRNCWRR